MSLHNEIFFFEVVIRKVKIKLQIDENHILKIKKYPQLPQGITEYTLNAILTYISKSLNLQRNIDVQRHHLSFGNNMFLTMFCMEG